MWPFSKERKNKKDWTVRYKEKLNKKKMATIVDVREPLEQFHEEKEI